MIEGFHKATDGTERIDMAFPIDAVATHPDMLKPGAPTEYQGIPIRRDAAIPMNEIHITSGYRLIKLKYEEKKQ